MASRQAEVKGYFRGGEWRMDRDGAVPGPGFLGPGKRTFEQVGPRANDGREEGPARPLATAHARARPFGLGPAPSARSR